MALRRWPSAAAWFIALTLLAGLSFACDDDIGEDQTPTATTAPASPSPAPEPTPTPRPPIPTAPATLAGCPVSDAVLCEFAIELQDALNAGDVQFIMGRLVAEERPCQGTYALAEDDIGCTSDADTSDPVVYNFNFASDCCFTTPAAFETQFGAFLADVSGGRWRLYAVVAGSPFSSGYEIVLIDGDASDAAVVEFGTEPLDGSVATPGVIKGRLGTFGLYPGATLIPWP